MKSVVMKSGVAPAVCIAAVILTPVAGRAQQPFILPGGDPSPTVDSAQHEPGIMSSTPGILSMDDTSPARPISVDSLAHAKAFAKNYHPVIIIDHKVKAVRDFINLKPALVATYRLQEANEKDVAYYGSAAKNGILTVTLVPVPPASRPTKKQR